MCARGLKDGTGPDAQTDVSGRVDVTGDSFKGAFRGSYDSIQHQAFAFIPQDFRTWPEV